MKEVFEKANVEIVELDSEDIITSSLTEGTDTGSEWETGEDEDDDEGLF